MKTLQQQIGLLTALRAIRMFIITMPVIVIYWQNNGLSMQDIFILQVIFSVAMVVLEIPSGYFADRFGNKLSLVLGSIISVIGFALYWLWPTYWGFVCAELSLAVASSLVSGSRAALLYDSLKAYGRTDDYTRYQGRLFAISNVSEATAALLAGVIASFFGITTVLAIQCFVLMLAIPVAIALDSHHDSECKPDSLGTVLQYTFIRNNRLRWFNIFTGASSAATLTIVWFAQPHWRSLGVEILYFGVIWAGLNFVVAIGSFTAHRIEQYFRMRTLFAGIAVAPFILYAALSWLSTSLVAVGFIALFWLLRGISVPIVSDYVQRECSDNNRATILSANTLVTRIIFSVFSPFLGWMVDVWSFGTAFLGAGIIFGSLSVLGYVYWIANYKRSLI